MSSRLLVIVGPTAVGKTSLSIRLAQTFNGQVISADSRQIYRGLDIGTDKASPEQQALVPHHLLDVVDPDSVLTLAQFQGRELSVDQRHSSPGLLTASGRRHGAMGPGYHRGLGHSSGAA